MPTATLNYFNFVTITGVNMLMLWLVSMYICVFFIRH